jgi:hypothetical protein
LFIIYPVGFKSPFKTAARKRAILAKVARAMSATPREAVNAVAAVAAAAPKKKQKEFIRKNLTSLGESVGARFGFKEEGKRAGDLVGGLINQLTGWGKYKIQRNSIVLDPSTAQFSPVKEGVRIRHREFIGNITGSVTFLTTNISINPGLVEFAPWLSSIAANFEFYQLHGLVFEYHTTSGYAVTASPALGACVLATQYDATEPPFTSKNEMLQAEFSTSLVPSKSGIHAIECKPGTNTTEVHKVRTGVVPAGGNIQFYDFGTTTIATEGMQSAYVIGELYVAYDISLLKPRPTSPGRSVATETLWFQCLDNSCTEAKPFGTPYFMTVVYPSTMQPIVYQTTETVTANYDDLYFSRAGFYHFRALWTTVLGTMTNIATKTLGSAMALQVYTADGANAVANFDMLLTKKTAILEFAFTVTTNQDARPSFADDPSHYLLIKGPVGATSGYVDVQITRIPVASMSHSIKTHPTADSSTRVENRPISPPRHSSEADYDDVASHDSESRRRRR